MGCCCSTESEKEGKSKRKKRVKKSPRMEDSRVSRQSERISMPKELSKFVALWDYKAKSSSELSFTKGETLQEEDDVGMGPEWVLCSKPGIGTGYAPRAWLAKEGSLETEPREQVDKFLGGMPDGMYMIRGRPIRGGYQYSLDVAFNNGAKHYHVKMTRDGRYALAKGRFDSIPDLIAFFKRNADNICCRLDAPAVKQPPENIELPADVQKNWKEIPRKQIQIVGDVLGKGHFGVVRKGVWRPTDKITLEVAVKELNKGLASARKDFLREAVAMKNLVHDRLVKLHGIVSADEPYWIVTEFVRDGSLKSFLRRKAKEEKWLIEPKLVEITVQIADGMRYLESKNVVHRDLAARNVLVEEKPGETIKETIIDTKIADFGMATMIPKAQRVKQESGSMHIPIKWTAPEAVEDLKFSSASDVWSFGVLMVEIFTHAEEPFKELKPKDYKAVLLKEKRLPLDKNDAIPEKVFDLILACCTWDPKNRISFQEVYEGLEQFYAKGVDPYEKYRT